jgi:hypothetical protein
MENLPICKRMAYLFTAKFVGRIIEQEANELTVWATECASNLKIYFFIHSFITPIQRRE